jgi:hypothetical protein
MNQTFFVCRFKEPGAEMLMDFYSGADDRVRDLVVCHWIVSKGEFTTEVTEGTEKGRGMLSYGDFFVGAEDVA